MGKIKFVDYPKTRQFADAIKEMKVYIDDRPTITYTGTVKLHGTNAGIVYWNGEIQAQSRKKLLDKEILGKNHSGFNQYVHDNEDKFLQIMQELHKEYCQEDQQIAIFGEWAGKGIQDRVAISNIEKSFFVFACAIYDRDKTDCMEEDKITWVNSRVLKFEGILNCYSIHDFVDYKVEVDLSKPDLSRDKMIQITKDVEKECPVAKHFGHEGVGEGIVWEAFYKGRRYIYKVKGLKHSSSNVKELAPVDVEKIKSVHAFVDYAVTKNRVDQAMFETKAENRGHTSDVIRWIANDVIDEEAATLTASNLKWKDVAKECANKARQLFFEILDSDYGK